MTKLFINIKGDEVEIEDVRKVFSRLFCVGMDSLTRQEIETGVELDVNTSATLIQNKFRAMGFKYKVKAENNEIIIAN